VRPGRNRAQVLRFLLWRLLGLVALLLAAPAVAWLLGGGLGAALRARRRLGVAHLSPTALASELADGATSAWRIVPGSCRMALTALLSVLLASAVAVIVLRWRARGARRYVRLRVDAYRTDRASAEAIVNMYAALHKRLLRRWWRRLLFGQPSLSLEVHHDGGGSPREAGERSLATPHAAWLAVSCPAGLETVVESALQAAYPNIRLRAARQQIGAAPTVLRLKKQLPFIKRANTLDRFEQERDPPVNRLLTAMGACSQPAFMQLALTPAPAFFERLAKRAFKHHEAELSRRRKQHEPARDRSILEDAELRGGLDVQHRPLFFADVRVIASSRHACELLASELRAHSAENHLVERGTSVRHGILGLYTRRVIRGEGNALPSFHKAVFATTELAALWQLPSTDYAIVPFARSGVPLAPAPPGVYRPARGAGMLRDTNGAVSIHPELRRQNTAVPGTVEQGKSSFLAATVAEDLLRERCAVIVLDPKGDAADVAVSLVPPERTCTFLDLSRPTCGFNPLAVAAPADVIADYVVAALKNLFTDADIRASSDRYLRNAIIAVLAHDRQATLWDAARLLSVGEEGYAYRRAVGARVRTMPEYKEISEFFTAELTAQLADARSTTTAKLDAPVNKLARLLNSPSIKRVLLNRSLAVDLDRVIANAEVLVVKGALGAMGAGNTAVLMQLLIGMLDAALARQQDLVPASERVAVALKVDEAPLVLNRGFAETMALKRSAGLETVACWQTDAQWTDRDVREQLDALFAHRVYFATAAVRDARGAAPLAMAEFSDSVRPGVAHLSPLARPDVRLHLPRHHAIVSLVTPAGRQPAFIAETIPLRVDRERLALHSERQSARGARHLTDLRQPHWDRRSAGEDGERPAEPTPRDTTPAAPRPRGGRPSAPLPAAVAASPAPHTHGAFAAGGAAAASYAELVELDRAQSVRWARPREPRTMGELDAADLTTLELIAVMEHLLSSQLHRRLNAGRAATTTQRRLKRLADAGLVERLQFHRRDGGGVPMCYAIVEDGIVALERNDRIDAAQAGALREGLKRAGTMARSPGRLRQARRDVHAAGWALALEQALGRACVLRGRLGSVLSPGTHGGERTSATAMAPADLRLPGGRVPHDFLRTTGSGERTEVERFDTVRPDATVQTGEVDVLVALDDRAPVGRAAAKLERYDHFLAGWSVHTRRYGRRGEARPIVVIVCRDAPRARELAACADTLLSACRAYAGEYPFDWHYPGRQGMLFVAERDVHVGSLRAHAVRALPPQVRVAAAHGDPRAAATATDLRDLASVLAPASGARRPRGDSSVV